MNSREALVDLALGLISSDKERSGKALGDAGKALAGGLLNQRPCAVAVTLRNESHQARALDPGAFRLKINGQTFTPTASSVSDAFPLALIHLAPGEQRAGTLVFMTPPALASAADEGSMQTHLYFDPRSARGGITPFEMRATGRER